MSASKLTSADGGPTGNALESLVPEIMNQNVGEAFRPGRPALKSAASRHVSDVDAREILRAIADSADYITAVAVWFDICWDVNRRAGLGMKADKLADPAARLARAHGLLFNFGAADRLQLAEAELIRHASEQSGLTAEAIHAEMRANEGKYAAQLDQAWAAPVPPEHLGSASGVRAMAFAEACGFAEEKPAATREATTVWNDWLRKGASSTRLDLELTRSSTLRRPDLIGRVSRPGRTSSDNYVMPLDLAINARLSRSLRSRKGAPTLSASRAISSAIAWSALPLGLPTEWARGIVTLGFEIAAEVYGDSSLHDAQAGVPQGYDGGALTMARRWRSSGLGAVQRGAALDDPLLASPHGRYLARLWIRVFRRALVSSSEPKPVEVWGHIYGAFKSICEETRRLGAAPIAGPDLVEVDDDMDPTASSVQRLLDFEKTNLLDRIQLDEVREVLGEMGSLLSKFRAEVLSLNLVDPRPKDAATATALEVQWNAAVAHRKAAMVARYAQQGLLDPYADLELPFELALLVIRQNSQ